MSEGECSKCGKVGPCHIRVSGSISAPSEWVEVLVCDPCDAEYNIERNLDLPRMSWFGERKPNGHGNKG